MAIGESSTILSVTSSVEAGNFNVINQVQLSSSYGPVVSWICQSSNPTCLIREPDVVQSAANTMTMRLTTNYTAKMNARQRARH